MWPSETLPFTNISAGMYRLIPTIAARNTSADRYLPTTISQSLIGEVYSTVSVPFCRSSASSRIDRKMAPTITVPLMK